MFHVEQFWGHVPRKCVNYRGEPMGILNEMFGDGEQAAPYEGELLAEGDYVSEKEKMLAGYKTFRKRYVLKNLLLRLFIAGLALASSVFMIVTSPAEDRTIPVFCLLLCGFVIGWFISQFVSNKRKYLKSVESLAGIPYHVEIFTDKIKIADMSPIPENVESTEEDEDEGTENAGPPATVIHLDSPIVDLLDREGIFILIVKKAYVFIIPKSAFSEENVKTVREKLSVIMGIRYKAG